MGTYKCVGPERRGQGRTTAHAVSGWISLLGKGSPGLVPSQSVLVVPITIHRYSTTPSLFLSMDYLVHLDSEVMFTLPWHTGIVICSGQSLLCSKEKTLILPASFLAHVSPTTSLVVASPQSLQALQQFSVPARRKLFLIANWQLLCSNFIPLFVYYLSQV